MCGIFGIVSSESNLLDTDELKLMADLAEQRGFDSSGLAFYQDRHYQIHRADFNIKKLIKKIKFEKPIIAMGHSRLITSGYEDNQPVISENVFVIHNGIIVNDNKIWNNLEVERKHEIDSEVIVAISEEALSKGEDISKIPKKVLSMCDGVVACALCFPKIGKMLLFSNNGSLYYGSKNNLHYFASEKYPLDKLNCKRVEQVYEFIELDIPKSENNLKLNDYNTRKQDLVPSLKFNKDEESMLLYPSLNLQRCTRCILPETMPFIRFNEEGVCNYCENYTIRNKPKPKEILFDLVKPYRREDGNDCIVPFSGGRDSCYGLHLIVNELKMKPVTYTYDWGMVTDLGRRNISRMCARLGVENIIIAADISKKRRNIAMNLKSWLKHPDLGMMSILTAGDKFFFKHVETVKRQTGINLNLWGINPLEVTHFKTGFLGIKPDFEEKRVYSHGILKQLKFHSHRFRAMSKSPGYFNRSLWDTLSGEYYRSFTEKTDYYHIFDFWRWDENLINDTLINKYDWECAIDTSTTWRIGDGTASFYNYVYYLAAGFTEHDTFRSNQIREGQITREEALKLVEDENQPRYSNIRWYLDTLGMDYKSVIKVVNNMKRYY